MKLLKHLLLAMMLTLALDALSKSLAERYLPHYSPLPVVGKFFQFTLTHNRGITFGLFSNTGPWPLLISGILIVSIVSLLAYAMLVRTLPSATGWPLGMFLGGGIANLGDRWRDQSVTDFLDVGVGAVPRSIFNLADLFIVGGLLFFLWISFFRDSETQGKTDEGLAENSFLRDYLLFSSIDWSQVNRRIIVASM